MQVGDAACGKTSLMKSFSSKEEFPVKYLMTTHADLTVETVVMAENIFVDLFVYDMPGQSIFSRVSRTCSSLAYMHMNRRYGFNTYCDNVFFCTARTACSPLQGRIIHVMCV